MTAVLTLPRLGETMEEGRIVAWLVAPGDAYRRGDPLLEVETDKTVVEVPALEDGELAEILAPEGAQVSVGDPVARLAGPSAPDAAPPQRADAAPPPAPAQATPNPARATETERRRATPAARRLAREAGVTLKGLPGTGRRGRIERADVARRIEGGRGAPSHRIAFDLTGPDTGASVVLLHGFAGDRTLWSGLSAGLVRAGRRLLAPDLAGHGATTAEAETPQQLSAGLADLVAETFDTPAHVVAHSLGAIPGTALAEAGAARSLTLIAPVGLGLAIDGPFIRGLAAAGGAGEVAHLLQRMTVAPLALSPEALDRIADTLGERRLTALAEALVGAAGQTVSLRARLARLADTLPVRIIAPHRDRILDWSEALTVSPRIAVHHLPNAGHMAAWDAPGAVLEIVREASAN